MATKSAVSAAARILQSKRKVRGTGNPKKLRPCPKCGVMCGTRELRYVHHKICKAKSLRTYQQAAAK